MTPLVIARLMTLSGNNYMAGKRVEQVKFVTFSFRADLLGAWALSLARAAASSLGIGRNTGGCDDIKQQLKVLFVRLLPLLGICPYVKIVKTRTNEFVVPVRI